MEGLTTNVTASVSLTGREWEIFSPEVMVEGSDSMSLEEATARHEECVAALNAAASEALSCGDPNEAWKIFGKVQRAWSYFGAEDSEPTWKFTRLMGKVYGEEWAY